MIKMKAVVITITILTFFLLNCSKKKFNHEKDAFMPVGEHFQKRSEIMGWMRKIESENPLFINLEYFGSSYKGQIANEKNMVAIEIFNKLKKPAFDIVITAGIHARELITTYTIKKITCEIIYKIRLRDAFWISYIDKIRIIIIPVMNPDGYDMAIKGWNWRKNCRIHKYRPVYFAPDSYGVDFNQNFDVFFKNVFNEFSLIWGGPYPFSEPETVAIRDYLLNKKVLLSLNLHSYGRYILFPWLGKINVKIEDYDKHIRIGRILASKMERYKLFEKGLTYEVYGNFGDWMYKTHKCLTFTIEIGNVFNPDKELTENWYEEVKPGILYLISSIGSF